MTRHSRSLAVFTSHQSGWGFYQGTNQIAFGICSNPDCDSLYAIDLGYMQGEGQWKIKLLMKRILSDAKGRTLNWYLSVGFGRASFADR